LTVPPLRSVVIGPRRASRDPAPPRRSGPDSRRKEVAGRSDLQPIGPSASARLTTGSRRTVGPAPYESRPHPRRAMHSSDPSPMCSHVARRPELIRGSWCGAVCLRAVRQIPGLAHSDWPPFEASLPIPRCSPPVGDGHSRPEARDEGGLPGPTGCPARARTPSGLRLRSREFLESDPRLGPPRVVGRDEHRRWISGPPRECRAWGPTSRAGTPWLASFLSSIQPS